MSDQWKQAQIKDLAMGDTFKTYEENIPMRIAASYTSSAHCTFILLKGIEEREVLKTYSPETVILKKVG